MRRIGADVLRTDTRSQDETSELLQSDVTEELQVGAASHIDVCDSTPQAACVGRKRARATSSRVMKKISRTRGIGRKARRTCAAPDCKKQPGFAMPNSARAIFCGSHKVPGMVNVVHKTCEADQCTKRPSFADPGAKIGRFCVQHKKEGMVNVHGLRCKEGDCAKRPGFAFLGATIGMFCARHKKEGMVNVVDKRCEAEGCDVRASFSFPGDTRRRFCVTHKQDGMLDVVSRKCEREGCDTQPVFAGLGEQVGRFCSEHKTDTMVDVMSRRCEHPSGCLTHPVFSDPGERLGRFCATHKAQGMVNVVDKRCEEAGCDKRPTFAKEGELRARYCAFHKERGMVDVHNKLCDMEGCSTHAYYGVPGQFACRCTLHREPLMTRFPRRRCRTKGCLKLALFGPRVGSAERCETHKLEDDADHVQRICSSCGLPWVLNAENLCDTCSPEGRASVHRKELLVRRWLEAADSGVPKTFVHDRRVEDGCSRKRPDFLFDMGAFVVVLEVDENQHEAYQCSSCAAGAIVIDTSLGAQAPHVRPAPDFITCTHACTCEWMRLYTILQDCGGRQMRVVRYNPDAFTPVGSTKKSRTGPALRKKAVLTTLSAAINRPFHDQDAILTVQYVCYDGANSSLISQTFECNPL